MRKKSSRVIDISVEPAKSGAQPCNTKLLWYQCVIEALCCGVNNIRASTAGLAGQLQSLRVELSRWWKIKESLHPLECGDKARIFFVDDDDTPSIFIQISILL